VSARVKARDNPGGESLPEFLQPLFGGCAGYIEIRAIEDKKAGRLVVRRWYDGPASLLAQLPDLLETAERTKSALFFGVLPRIKNGGKTRDILPGRVLWVDLDFKDFEGGEAEARKRLGELPLEPSFLVRSGHGLHLYWLLQEQENATELSRLSKGLARVLGGDHAFDAARLLRLPGSYNRKDPENPIQVEVEALESDRAYNISEIEDVLDLTGGGAEQALHSPGEQTCAGPKLNLTEPMSDRVLALLDSQKAVRDLFEGRGKTPIGQDGRSQDLTSSGYDFSFALSLVSRGVTDPSELARALACRPDGVAKEKGQDYIQRTVVNALARGACAKQERLFAEVDFKVERVRIFKSDRAEYEFTVSGVVFRVTSAQLNSSAQFRTAFMDALHYIPKVPKKRDLWIEIVNHWLEDAEVVELGEDASDEAALREAVEAEIANMGTMEVVEDLDRGQAHLLEGGGRAFKSAPILLRLKEQEPDLTRSRICRVFRGLGYKSRTHRITGKEVRLWS